MIYGDFGGFPIEIDIKIKIEMKMFIVLDIYPYYLFREL